MNVLHDLFRLLYPYTGITVFEFQYPGILPGIPVVSGGCVFVLVFKFLFFYQGGLSCLSLSRRPDKHFCKYGSSSSSS